MNPEDRHHSLPPGPHDLVVIGGGIIGAAVAREAVLRGARVVVLEREDIASGASSSSTKLLHGGLLDLTRLRPGSALSCARERERLLRLASPVAWRVPFLMPIRQERGPGRRRWRIALRLHDALGTVRRPDRGGILSPAEVAERLPGLSRERLAGAALWSDGLMDDARLAVHLLVDAREVAASRGCPFFVRTRCEAIEVRETSPVRIRARDHALGSEQDLSAHRVVEVRGAWSPPGEVRLSRGAHLLLEGFPLQAAVIAPRPDDGRLLFALPWRGYTLIGSTDTPWEGPPETAAVALEDARYLMEGVRGVFAERDLSGARLAGAFAGVRSPPRAGRGRARALLERILPPSPGRTRLVRRGGILRVLGGRGVTSLRLARDIVDRALGRGRTRSLRRPLPGSRAEGLEELRAGQRSQETGPFGEEEIQALWNRYGDRADRIVALTPERPELAEPVAPGAPLRKAEVVHAVREEFVTSAVDLVRRRTVLWAGPGNGRELLSAIDDCVREELGFEPLGQAERREAYRLQAVALDEIREEFASPSDNSLSPPDLRPDPPERDGDSPADLPAP